MPGKLSKLGWYWHRLRAMSPREVSLRLQKKLYARQDRRGLPSFSGLNLAPSEAFPRLPAGEAPAELLEALRRGRAAILAGRWNFFGHLPLQVDDPPRWQFDYLAAIDQTSAASAFGLTNRAQPTGADIKLLWEPSRWNQLVRLAMAAWLLEDEPARDKCVEWLFDWCKHNPPFRGINWTSGLESGIRLIQFTWIDALLAAAGAPAKQLAELRQQILPAHLWYTWRYRSFGSSANNHLIGELAGVALALARWPGLAEIAQPLHTVQSLWEREVLAQFAEDGGNNEQALGYHLFSWEFCWQTLRALQAAGSPVSPDVEQRLIRAGEFYHAVKPRGDTWDYGDSDNAFVTPLFLDETKSSEEWWQWFADSSQSPALRFWWGDFPTRRQPLKAEWRILPNSGYAIFEGQDWFLRFDCSPLGYLTMAPHGHLDALHLSAWWRGEPVLIDPGTCAYYADRPARDYLADWAAHNGPNLKQPPEPFPRRRGVFLWGGHHEIPVFKRLSPLEVEGQIKLPYGTARRRVAILPEQRGFEIRDSFEPFVPSGLLTTRWKFAPRLTLQCEDSRHALARSEKTAFRFHWEGWESSIAWTPSTGFHAKGPARSSDFTLASIVSPAFRSLQAAPYLHLEASLPAPAARLLVTPA